MVYTSVYKYTMRRLSLKKRSKLVSFRISYNVSSVCIIFLRGCMARVLIEISVCVQE